MADPATIDQILEARSRQITQANRETRVRALLSSLEFPASEAERSYSAVLERLLAVLAQEREHLGGSADVRTCEP